jgi:phosphatidylglycerophosphatase A
VANLSVAHKFLGSGFFTGYLKGPTGTYGSFVALLIYLIPGVENLVVLIPLIVITTLYGIWVCGKFEGLYGKDPKEATIDEFAGMWISLIWVPKEILFLSLSFFIWRALDIIKPFPARNFEKIEGGLGVMADDIMSGVYTFVIMQGLIYLFK